MISRTLLSDYIVILYYHIYFLILREMNWIKRHIVIGSFRWGLKTTKIYFFYTGVCLIIIHSEVKFSVTCIVQQLFGANFEKCLIDWTCCLTGRYLVVFMFCPDVNLFANFQRELLSTETTVVVFLKTRKKTWRPLLTRSLDKKHFSIPNQKKNPQTRPCAVFITHRYFNHDWK